jgi:iron complex outermembrane receptor protein
MQNNFVAMSAMALVLSMSFAQTGHAEEAGDGAQVLKEVVVTATTTAQTVTDAPASVSVVTAKDIEEKNVQRVDDALTTLPGVNVQSRGDGMPNNYQNQIMLRGFSYYNQTAVLVDGQAINDAFTGAVDTSMIPIESIKQIEVVPGPFSALYGGNAMGGVINIITREPEKQEINIAGSVGSNSTQHEAISYGNKWALNQGGSVGLLLSADHGQSNGYVNALVTTTKAIPAGVAGAQPYTTNTGASTKLIGDQGNVPWLSDNLGAKLYLDFSAAQQLVLGVSYHDGYIKPALGNSYLRDAFGNPVTSFTGVYPSSFLGAQNGQDSHRYTADYTVKVLDDLKLKVKASVMDDHYWYVSTISNVSTPGGGAGTWTDIPSAKNDINITLEGAVGQKSYLVGGVFLGYDDMHKKLDPVPDWRITGTPASVSPTEIFDGYTHSSAVFLQDEFDFDNKLSFYVGARKDFWDTNGTEVILPASGLPTLNQQYSNRSDSALNPKISVVYKLDASTTLHTAWGTAFRAPQISEMYSPYGSGTSITLGNPGLQPERNRSWEVGAEHEFSTLTDVRATYYASNVTNLIYTDASSVVVPGYTTVTQYDNIASVSIRGLETEVRQKKVFANVDAFANYTYNDSLVTSGSNSGKQTPNMPQHFANFGLQGSEGKAFGSLTASYKGKAFGTTNNSDTNNGVYGSYDAYWLVNGQIGYQLTKSLKGSFAINNILNKTYFQYYEMPGRTYTFRLAAKL